MEDMPKILIIDLMHESIVPLLTHIGYEVDYEPAITVSEIHERISNYEGLIVRSKISIDKALIEKGTRLKFIARAGAGIDQVDETYLTARKITLLNAPEGNRVAVGEHTLGMLLCLMNKLNTANTEVKAGIWDREANRGFEISGKTIGIIGYGNMGQAFAKCLKGFDGRVLAHDKFKKDFSDEFAQEASLEELFETAEVLSLHIPLTSDSRNWADSTFFSKFKKPIWFLNTARGEIASFKAVAESIHKGHILGAGLDVLENEKLKTLSDEQRLYFNELVNAPNVLFTPHVAGWTHESYRKINEVLTQKIKQLN
jgi:D-3-phosphoglycerate dehydrogenase